MVQEIFRSGAKLGGELTDEFDFVHFNRGKGDWFKLDIDEDALAPKWSELTERAAEHGFRVEYWNEQWVRFTRMDTDPTDLRNNEDHD